MKAKDLHFMQQLANDRIAEKQNKLDLLRLLYKFNTYEEFGYTKETIENEMKRLEEYIHIATH